MRVVNLRKEKYDFYIGRGSPFGNPFVIGKDGTREEVIAKYENWLRKKISEPGILEPYSVWRKLLDDMPKNIILGCYCKPKACHGDVIVKIWKELHNEVS